MKGGTMYEQKDIILIPFPYSDLTGSKKRPALIISNQKLNKSDDRICCLITSNIRSDDIEIKKENFKEGTLPFKSALRLYRLFTIDKRIIIKKLCTINNNFYENIIKQINEYIK
ncbi:type II toxin-antitoxin system PemK/MazF family toxin [Candidatus Pacearchaeota archaeon]|nr:type II toxin-antitoxin system PemK/MazF family toxin [Candidatus Pacearchaeota archaeon]